MPELSIIICTYNRDLFLPDALESLRKQNLDPVTFEILVVNNNSNDRTEEICLNFKKKYPDLNFKYFVETSQGLSFARNRGIKESEGKYIAFIDDDAVAENDYAKNILESYKKYPDTDAFGGKVLPIYPDSMEPEWMSKYIQGVVSKVDYGNKAGIFEKKKYPVGCNMIFKKEVFEELGAFNVDLQFRSDDKFIFIKLRKNKKKILYVPNVVVHHNIDASRLTKIFIKKLSHQIGSTERIRLKGHLLGQILKIGEYKWKFFAALVLAIMFLLKGQIPKAQYIVLIRWNILTGFFHKVEYIKQQYEKNK